MSGLVDLATERMDVRGDLGLQRRGQHLPRGPGRGVWFQLYVVLDIFSRYVVAWTVQNCEDSEIAKTMLEEAMGIHGIP